MFRLMTLTLLVLPVVGFSGVSKIFSACFKGGDGSGARVTYIGESRKGRGLLSEFEREQSKLGDLQGKGYGLKGLTQEQAEAVEEKRMEQLSVNFFMMPVSEDDSVPITKEISEKQSGANIFAGGFQKLLSAASLRLKKKKYKEL